jgi:1,5-anhydro-D-fructose reductase (1,5-anhydro-D-mannitol-forming)
MTVGWAIIGIGKLADMSIAPAIARTADSRLAAVCSRDLGRAEAFAGRHGAEQAYDDLRKMVDDPAVDVVYIASPNGLHREHVLTAVRAGKHVLVEKPMTLTVDDGRAVVEEAARHDVKLGVGFQNRHKTTNRAAREAIAAGRVGQLAYVDISVGAGQNVFPFDTWRSEPELAGGGTLLNQGTHAIDLLGFLTGQRIVEVTCFLDRDGLEDVAVANCRLDGGTLATLASNQVLGGTRRDWMVVGRDGWLLGRGSLAGPAGDELLLHRDGEATVLATSPRSAHEEEVEAFTQAVLGSAPVNGTGEDGLDNVAVVEALYRSARDKRPVAVEDVATSLAR